MPDAETLKIMAPALAAGAMVAVTHAPLGVEVLRRGIIFIDLTIAQIAGLGLVVASFFSGEGHGWAAQATALSAALAAAFLFREAEKRTPTPRHLEAVIGSSFVLAASLTLLLLADSPFGGEEIKSLLSGQILFVTWSDILTHAPVYALITALWILRPRARRGVWFYILFATAITSSVQLVGVYVVFASLILPALGAVGAASPTVAAWAVGAVSVVAGIAAATLLDAPAGPVLVTSYCVVAALALVCGKRCRRNGERARPEGFEPPTS